MIVDKVVIGPQANVLKQVFSPSLYRWVFFIGIISIVFGIAYVSFLYIQAFGQSWFTVTFVEDSGSEVFICEFFSQQLLEREVDNCGIQGVVVVQDSFDFLECGSWENVPEFEQISDEFCDLVINSSFEVERGRILVIIGLVFVLLSLLLSRFSTQQMTIEDSEEPQNRNQSLLSCLIYALGPVAIVLLVIGRNRIREANLNTNVAFNVTIANDISPNGIYNSMELASFAEDYLRDSLIFLGVVFVFSCCIVCVFSLFAVSDHMEQMK